MESYRFSRFALTTLFLLTGALVSTTAKADRDIEIAGIKADEVIRGGLAVEVLPQRGMDTVIFRVGDYAKRESHAPFSLAGNSRDKLFELDTELYLKDGPNTLEAVVIWTNGTRTTRTIDFVVANNSWVGEEDDTLDLPIYTVTSADAPDSTAPSGPIWIEGLPDIVAEDIYVSVGSDEPVQSVRFVVPEVLDRTESHKPYSMNGDVFGRLLPWDSTRVADGEYELSIVATMADGRKERLTQSFIVQNQTPIDTPAGEGQVMVVGLPKVASGRVYPLVRVNGTAESVRMVVPGVLDRTEFSEPYSLAGDILGLARPWNTNAAPNGEHELQIAVNFADGSTENFTYRFEVDNQAAAPSSPALANGKTPTPPKHDHLIRLGPGKHDLRGKIERWGVTKITGPRNAVITKIGYIPGASIILEGVSVETGGYKMVEGDRTGEAWLINVDFRGKKFDPRDPNAELTWAPTWQFRKAVYINSKFRYVLRGNRGYTEIYNCTYEDVYEDLFQGSGVLRNVKAKRVGYPVRKPGAHTDIIQAFGIVDVDGLEVDQYSHQGINLQHAAASGSKFRNIRLKNHKGYGSGVLLETTHGDGGPSNITFENVEIDEIFRVRGINMLGHEYKNWEGNNIVVRNSKFPTGVPRDRRFRVENTPGGFTTVTASGASSVGASSSGGPADTTAVVAVRVDYGEGDPGDDVAAATTPTGTSMSDVPAVLADLGLSEGTVSQVEGPIVIRKDNAVLANMRIVMPEGIDRHDYGLRIDAANVVIHNVEIIGPGNSYGRGVVFTDESMDARVSELLVQGFHSGVLLRGTGHQFERCVFTDMDGTGTGTVPVSVYGDRVEGVSFKHCVFNDLGRGGNRNEAGPHIELFRPWEATRDTGRQLEDHALGVRFTACVVADGKAQAFAFGTGGSFVDGIVGPHGEASYAAPPGGNVVGNVVFHRDGSIASTPWFFWHSSIGRTLAAPLYDFEDQDQEDAALLPASRWDRGWVDSLLLTDRSDLGDRIDAARAAFDEQD